MIKKCSDKDCFVHDGETCRIGEMDKADCEKYNPIPKPTYFERDGEPCGECRLSIGERCDICSVKYVA